MGIKECEQSQLMWPGFRADSQEIYCEFKTLSGKPIDVSGKTLTFTMRLDKMDNICHAYDLHFSITIPFDNNAKQGKVLVEIPHQVTRVLLPGRVYSYDFQISDNSCETFTEIATAGWGSREVMRDVTTGACNEPDSFPTCR